MKIYSKYNGLGFTFSFLLLSLSFSAQNVGINSTGASPNASAMLDVSETNKGVLVPRITLTGTTDIVTVPSPATSLLIFNTATASDVTPGYYYWDSSKWVRLIESGTASGADWSLLGNTGTTAGVNFIGTTDAQDLVLKTNGTENVHILNSSGNVGIGTATPTTRVDVNGDLRVRTVTAGAGIDQVLVADTNGVVKQVAPNPVGEIIIYPVAIPPAGYLICDGSAISRTTYADLFAVLGGTYGVGDGSTTFNLPDLRGEFVRGLDNGRGVDAGRTIGSWQVATAFMGDGDGFNMPVPNLNNTSQQQVLGFELDVLPQNTVNITTGYTTPSGFSCTFTGVHSNNGANTCTDFARTRPRNIAMNYCIRY